MNYIGLRAHAVEAAIAVAALLASAGISGAQGARVGATSFVKPPATRAINGGIEIRRFPGVAYDADNDRYLVAWGNFQIGARFIAPDGTPEGEPVILNEDPKSETRSASTARVACAPGINACLVTWIEEFNAAGLPDPIVVGRLVRYAAGAVQFLTDPLVINRDGYPKHTESPASVAYSPSAGEFLVSWSAYTGGGGGRGPDVLAQRVNISGTPIGPVIIVAATEYWEGYPQVIYNSVQNQFLVLYYFETTSTQAVGVQRIEPGTGVAVGGRSTVMNSLLYRYPQVAHDSRHNQYLAITWQTSNPWMLTGRLADSAGEPLGSGPIPLAASGGGDGLGIAYNAASDSYFCVYQSQYNDEVWGVVVDSSGSPGTQFQVTLSGTKLAVQPQVATSSTVDRWYAVASEQFKQVMGQLVEKGAGQPPPSCLTPSPGPGWTCDPASGTWLPPSSGGSTGGCTTIQPGADWTCVNGSWLPPGATVGGGTTGGCTTVQPGADWTCVNGSWLPPGSGGGTGGGTTGGCTTVQPGTGWTCVNGNWLPPGTGGGTGGGTTGGCTTVQPGADWTCVNGNWLPPGVGGGTGGGTTGGCTTVQPGTGWTCVNGNWLPPASGGGTTGGCTTVQPGPDWTCVNGNWIPPGPGGATVGGCTTVQPGPDWTCVSGNWFPPGGATTMSSSLGTVLTLDWVRLNGTWLPPSHPLVIVGSRSRPA